MGEVADQQSEAVQNGEFSIVFASPELAWLGDQMWRKMVKTQGVTGRTVPSGAKHILKAFGSNEQILKGFSFFICKTFEPYLRSLTSSKLRSHEHV